MAKIYKRKENSSIIVYSLTHAFIWAFFVAIVFTIAFLIFAEGSISANKNWWIPLVVSILVIFVIVFIYVYWTEKTTEAKKISKKE